MRPDALRDKVALIGMGCTKFGEIWDKGPDDLIIDATFEALEDAGVGLGDIQAAWVGTQWTAGTGALLAQPLKFCHLPITRVENACATGIEALRQACMGLVSETYDLVLAVGVEKLKDTGVAGLPGGFMHPVYGQEGTAAGRWALIGTRYFADCGLDPEEAKRTLAKIAVKNHHNGLLHPKAHLRREVTVEQVMAAPMIAWPLGLFDCCGVTDGAAAAVLCRADMARSFRDDYVVFKGFGLAIGPCWGKEDVGFKYNCLPETIAAGEMVYEQAGIVNPREELSLACLHDCFTIAELMEYEALGLSPVGRGKEDVDAGTFALDGPLPVNPDGGLKSFGHPIGATGVRMCYEIYKQLQGRAELPERQLKNPKLGLAIPQGGHPGFLLPIATVLGLGG